MKVLITGGSGFIGTNLIDYFEQKNYEIVNLSDSPPKKKEQFKYWIECNLANVDKLCSLFLDIKPQIVIHLAANTDIKYKKFEDYYINVLITKNLIKASKRISSVERFIFTSTQLVHKPGFVSLEGDNYNPVNAYALSKVICEKLIKTDPTINWTILRLTYIWGPWYPEFRYPIWKLIKKGLYFFPGQDSGVRCYGYVGNTVRQIEKFLILPVEKISKKVFYIGDKHMRTIDWINAFAVAIKGKKVKTMPKISAKLLAQIGDFLIKFGIPFILNSHRLNNLIEDYIVPIEPTLEIVGKPEISLEQGVKETIEWLKERNLI